MKTTHAFLVIFSLAFLVSCNPYELDDETIYWNSNTLIRAQLKGNVKQVNWMNGTNIENFDSDGFITSVQHADPNSAYTESYDYTGSRLVSITRNTTLGKSVSTITMNFDYQNIEKYVLQDKYRLLNDALVPNLKSKTGNPEVTYVLNGETMFLIENYTEGNTDTTVIEYTGKYPTRIIRSDNTEIKDFEYATNGMFKKYSVFTNSPTWNNKATYYFHPDDQYLRLDSMVQVHTEGSFVRKDIDTYEYDTNKNLILFKNYMGEEKYIYPDVDSIGNWLTREIQYRSNSNQPWGLLKTETRTITYY